MFKEFANRSLTTLTFFLWAGAVAWVQAQNPSTPISGQDTVSRPIITSVPFLTVAPDARSAAMGDAGVALSADANATFWNPSKLAFADKAMGASFSYTPWLTKIVSDMYLANLSGYKKISDDEAIALSMRYFDLGSMQFTDAQRNPIQEVNPREYAIDLTYARKLSQRFGMGVTGRFIRSNLNGDFISGAADNGLRPANTVAVDISAFYQNEDVIIGQYESTVAFGANISNMGPKISYTDDSQLDFIPTNLRLGTAITTKFDSFNKLTFAFDINKLMVPTPPVVDENGNVVGGRDSSDQGWVSGMFVSFADAPDGFSEEMRELTFSTGLEYWYNDIIALRGGYFHENRFKGNRQYLTVGVGFALQVLNIDVAYLTSTQQNHPLQDTVRFTLSLNFDKKATETEDVDTEVF